MGSELGLSPDSAVQLKRREASCDPRAARASDSAVSKFFWLSQVILYAVISLTVVRMVPVALALAGTGLSRVTVLFMGWFGPRGLASIVLGLVYLEQQANLPGESTIRLAVVATVLLSIFAHGLSTLSGIDIYARKIASLDSGAPEHKEIAKYTKEKLKRVFSRSAKEGPRNLLLCYWTKVQ